ncbi:MAG: hypothetical protein ACYTEL_01540 [Planctomycetota bacterium]|jgi:hypothetical protein
MTPIDADGMSYCVSRIAYLDPHICHHQKNVKKIKKSLDNELRTLYDVYKTNRLE